MTQPALYGRDLGVFWTDTGPDADSGFTEVTGINVFAQSILCRLTTPFASVAGCPNDCLDVRSYLGAGIKNDDVQRIQSEVQTQVLRDERAQSCNVRASYDTVAKSLTLVIRITCAAGPFTMTLAVSAVTVELLNLSAN